MGYRYNHVRNYRRCGMGQNCQNHQRQC